MPKEKKGTGEILSGQNKDGSRFGSDFFSKIQIRLEYPLGSQTLLESRDNFPFKNKTSVGPGSESMFEEGNYRYIVNICLLIENINICNFIK